MKGLIHELERARRAVTTGTTHTVALRRAYDAPIEDVWDAITDPERIGRWFLPVTGEFRLGGSYQLEGNAHGEITECEPPKRFTITWIFGDDHTLVTVELTSLAPAKTEFQLEHHVTDNEHWKTYGPGATGVGWDLALLGLAFFVRGEPFDATAFEGSPESLEFMRRSAQDWGTAHEASGVAPTEAQQAAERTAAAYAPVT